MGRHASTRRRPGLAPWTIVTAVVAVLLAAAVIGYGLTVRSRHPATCASNTVLPVLASSAVAVAVGEAAKVFNAGKPVARSTCVTAVVSTLPGAASASALAAGWRNQSTAAPGLWVADSLADVATLDAADSAMTAGHPRAGVASSPVVLATRAAPAGSVSWKSLANGSPDGPVLALPDPQSNRASGKALESLLAAVRPAGDGGGAVDADTVAGATAMFRRLAAAAPTAPSTTRLALAELASGRGGFTAVPVLESDLAAFNSTVATPLTAIYPAGPTASDELVPIPLTAPWVSPSMSDAAAAFDAFLGDTRGAAVLRAAHFRVAAPPADPAVGAADTPVTALSEAPASVLMRINAAWTAAAGTRERSAAGGSTAVDSTAVDSTAVDSTAVDSTAVDSTASDPVQPPESGAVRSTGPSSSTTSAPVVGSFPATSPSPLASSSTNAKDALAGAPPPAGSAPVASSSPVTSATGPATLGAAVTVLLDTSASMSTPVEGRPLISWTRSAVTTVISGNPTRSFGVWSFSTDYTQLVPVGPLTQKIGGVPRTAAITAALNSLTTGGNRFTYGAIRTAMTNAVMFAVPGRPNHVIVVTDGPDATPDLSRDAAKAQIAALVAQNKGVVLDILGLPGNVDAGALAEMAKAGGGTFTMLASPAELTPALMRLAASWQTRPDWFPVQSA